MIFFISEAMAESAPAQGQGDPFGPLIMMVLIFVLFYFLLIRPQAKRAKEHKQMVEALSKGDELVTNGGILGKAVEVDDSFITLEIANNVQIKVQRQSIASLVPKGTYKGN